MIVSSAKKWDAYYLDIASVVASKSKDPNTKVGSVLVGPHNGMIASGFNGLSPGVIDWQERYERPEKYSWVLHAESSLIAFAARHGIRTEGATLYCTHFSCSGCSRLIVAAGIRRVVFAAGKTSMPQKEFDTARQMFYESEIECEEI